ncbi:MAG: hypoxanthine phosphoribosyltransferase [Acidimicrobiales bacterium]|nr:hypoxanthine phosphoribosyltransferase [Acidimicrobiales bacterium]
MSATPNPPHRILIGEDDVHRRIEELGTQICADYDGRSLLCVGVLKGAFVFLADLVRAIDLPLEVDFMAVSSYGDSTRTSGVVRIVKDLDIDLAGRDVLLVEDIIDSGLTLRYLRRNLLARHPASLEVCALLAKVGRLVDDIKYVGFEIPDEFVIGYGLDLAEKFRNLADIRIYQGE